MVFYSSFTDIQAGGNLIIRQTLFTAHLVNQFPLGRHLFDRTADNTLQLTRKQRFFFRLGDGSFQQKLAI